MDEQPAEAEVLSWFDRLSNWGRWGRDDQAGTLNLIKPEHRVAAAQLVSEGRTVSRARDIVTAYGHPENSAQMYFVSSDGACSSTSLEPRESTRWSRAAP